MEIVISRHVVDRARERLGVPRRSVRRLVEAAWERGARVCTTMHADHQRRLWAGGVFCFWLTERGCVCSTVFWRADQAPEPARTAGPPDEVVHDFTHKRLRERRQRKAIRRLRARNRR